MKLEIRRSKPEELRGPRSKRTRLPFVRWLITGGQEWLRFVGFNKFQMGISPPRGGVVSPLVDKVTLPNLKAQFGLMHIALKTGIHIGNLGNHSSFLPPTFSG